MAMRLVILGEVSITCYFNVITVIKRKYYSFMLHSKKYGDLALCDYIISRRVGVNTNIHFKPHNGMIQTSEVLILHIGVNIKIRKYRHRIELNISNFLKCIVLY